MKERTQPRIECAPIHRSSGGADVLGAPINLRLFRPVICLLAHDSDAQSDPPATPSREGLCGWVVARLCGAEKRRACGLARSANRELTRCACLSGVNAVNAASCATGPQDRASQGSLSAAKAATVKRCGPPAQAFAASLGKEGRRNEVPVDRAGPDHG